MQALLGAHITEAKLEHVRIDGKPHNVPFIGFKTGTGLQVITLMKLPAALLAACNGV